MTVEEAWEKDWNEYKNVEGWRGAPTQSKRVGFSDGWHMGWNSRGEAISKACKRLVRLEGKAVAVTPEGEIYDFCMLLDNGLLVSALYDLEWTIEDPKPKRIEVVQEYCDRYGVKVRYRMDSWEYYHDTVWVNLPMHIQKAWPAWEGPEEESLHEPIKKDGE